MMTSNLGCYYSLNSFSKKIKNKYQNSQLSEHFGSQAVWIIEVGLYMYIVSPCIYGNTIDSVLEFFESKDSCYIQRPTFEEGGGPKYQCIQVWSLFS